MALQFFSTTTFALVCPDVVHQRLVECARDAGVDPEFAQAIWDEICDDAASRELIEELTETEIREVE